MWRVGESRRPGAGGGNGWRCGAAVAGLCELRSVRRLRSPRRALSGAGLGIEGFVRATSKRAGMASATPRVSLLGTKTKRAAHVGEASAQHRQPLEHRILLTATLCLLAFGAVMVYSASSATSLEQSGGTGSGYLVKYVMYGAIGLVLMRLLARDGVAKVQSITAPLLAISFVLVLAVHIPHVGVSVNGARRWIGPGPFQFQPSELMKLALVLYAATLLAKRPGRVYDLRDPMKPLLFVVGGACLLVVTQPDLGTAMVIAFTTGMLLIAAGIPLRNLAILADRKSTRLN